tara:strand:+ start:1715 stop:1852 length:138 start_codon:yes stop_codon:yes gene_type:complete
MGIGNALRSALYPENGSLGLLIAETIWYGANKTPSGKCRLRIDYV